jgi:Potential Queuosine, Q, salvage protein family
MARLYATGGWRSVSLAAPHQAHGILDAVRAACRRVAERARHVRIDASRLARYRVEPTAPPTSDPARRRFPRDDLTVAYVLCLDAVNFGSGWFPQLDKPPGMSGYFTVATRLRRRFERSPPAAGDLEGLTPAGCAELFGQDLHGPAGELMALFATALNDLGRYLLERFDGSFTALVESSDGSAERLVDLLRGMEFFRDLRRYGRLEVPLYKRAQLCAADLSSAGVAEFGDLDRLTAFADNLVPHVLRLDGVLRYDSGLAARIDRGALIPAGSEEEVELRACTVHAVELLTREHDGMSAAEVDAALWYRGQAPRYKAVPRHRTRTVHY